MDKLQILTDAKAMREQEVFHYQINIDNYTIGIEQIGSDPDLQEFKAQLQATLASEIREQRKAQLMLDVINTQLAQLQAQ
jgi:hypothetical protein